MKETDISFNSGWPVNDVDREVERHTALVEFDEAKRKPQCKLQIEVQDFKNDHTLTFHERGTTLWFDETCYGCKRLVKGSSYYTCQYCKKYFHKLCAELPLLIKHHPLHSQHPLAILPANNSEGMLCDQCGNFCYDGGYKCDRCEFLLDIKCASLSADQSQNLQYKKIIISHPFHDHKLTFSTHTHTRLGADSTCFACHIPILNTPYYYCLGCLVFFHEKCLEIPKEIKHPYHPQHLLYSFTENLSLGVLCMACKLSIKGICYQCNGCGFSLHTRCANYITSTLKSKSHKHILYSFAKFAPEKFPSILSKYGPAYDKSTFKCKVCRKQCIGSFYRCVRCDLNFHSECLPVPYQLRHPCHMDPLTLMDSMCEDDSGEYYCEICTELRNPNHGVYCCKECMVFTHIGCALEEVLSK
ncbi:hypothetical protein Tsubulata_031240 [Turnera subulata]|uniref:Phorbol-ester/DAG-type domain-containing protein n=1 Tax=Turnera subulata TaxID=218843 RepID=A0A9Q0GE62_9ROSI|nr:hypothetical protein Tsubulata_031240 [Turnera subulata]